MHRSAIVVGIAGWLLLLYLVLSMRANGGATTVFYRWEWEWWGDLAAAVTSLVILGAALRVRREHGADR